MKGRFLLQYGGKRKLLQTMLLINKQKHAVIRAGLVFHTKTYRPRFYNMFQHFSNQTYYLTLSSNLHIVITEHFGKIYVRFKALYPVIYVNIMVHNTLDRLKVFRMIYIPAESKGKQPRQLSAPQLHITFDS